MTREQLLEAEKVQPLLEECRTHLDNAMYRMGAISDEDHDKLRAIYDKICEAQDLM